MSAGTGLSYCTWIDPFYYFILRNFFSFLYRAGLVLPGTCINKRRRSCVLFHLFTHHKKSDGTYGTISDSATIL